MVKRLILLSPVLIGLLFFGIAGEDSADPSAQLEQAQTYTNSGQYEQAEGIYQQIVTDYPGTEYAFKAQKNLPFLYIAMDQQPEAEAALQKLLTDFSEHQYLPHAVHKIAEQCCKLEKGDTVRQLYQNVLDNQPQSEQAIWLQMGLALSDIYVGDDNAAEAAIDELIVQFFEDNWSAEAVGQIAWSYRILKKYERAKQLYQYVVDNWAYKERAIFSQRGVALCNIALGDETAAWAAIEKLLIQFSEAEHVAEVVYPLAQKYHKVKKYEKARNLYQYVVDNQPQSKHAIWAQVKLVELSIEDGDDTAAQAAIEKLLTQFPGREGIAKRIVWLADKCRRKFGEHDKARELYQYVLDNWPEDEYAIESLKGMALSSIGLGDVPNTEAAIEELISSFPGHKHLAEAVYLVARELEGDEKAAVLYQYVIENCSDSKFAILSEVKIGGICIRLGDEAVSRAIFDRVLVDFADHPDLPEAVAVMAYEYYKQALLKETEGYLEQTREYFLKTIVECERIITQLPESPDTAAVACYYLAVCHERLGQYIDAVEYYQMVLDNWPDYRYAWNALFMIGRCYEQLEKSGLMSKSEVDPIIKAVYEQLLEDYPACKAAKHARRWLSRHK